MVRRKLGNQGLEVSALGLGCMGMSYHRGPVPPERDMITLIHQAIELGITFFDTAEVYGPYINEELLGKALTASNDVVIATKFGFDIKDGKSVGINSRPQHIKKAAENSLKRLKREQIDLLYQHRPDPEVPVEDVAGAVQELVKEGKVKYFGLCEVDGDTVRRAHKILPISAIQSEYSLMWREPESALFPVLEELNIGFVPYSPVGRAFLSGTINEHTNFSAENDNRASLPRFTPAAIKANQTLIAVINDFATEHAITPSQVALGWLLSKRNWIVPIPGTTKYNHLKNNFDTAKLSINADKWHSLEARISAIQITGNRY